MSKELTLEQVKVLEARGRQLAADCGWQGELILAIAYDALVDANYHKEAEKLMQLTDELFPYED